MSCICSILIVSYPNEIVKRVQDIRNENDYSSTELRVRGAEFGAAFPSMTVKGIFLYVLSFLL